MDETEREDVAFKTMRIRLEKPIGSFSAGERYNFKEFADGRVECQDDMSANPKEFEALSQKVKEWLGGQHQGLFYNHGGFARLK